MPGATKRVLFSFFTVIPIVFSTSCSFFSNNGDVDFYRSNPTALFNSLLHRSLELETFEGSGHLTVESPVEGFQGKARVYYRQPDSLLVVIQAGFGVPVGRMLVIGNKVQLYNIRDKILFISEGADVPLDDLIGMNLRAANLIEATLGLPRPPELISNNDTLQWNPVDDKFSYRVNSIAGEKRYLADPGKQVFMNYSLIRPTEKDTTVCTFKQFRKFKNIRIPQHIQVTRYDQKERLSLYYTRMQVNKHVPADRFQLKVSEKVDVVHLTKSDDE